jgi:hypothetical protein
MFGTRAHAIRRAPRRTADVALLNSGFVSLRRTKLSVASSHDAIECRTDLTTGARDDVTTDAPIWASRRKMWS